MSTFSFENNRLYGHKLPKTILIKGKYSLNVGLVIDLKKHNGTKIPGDLRRKLVPGPYMCSSGIDKRIVEVSSEKIHKKLENKLKTLRETDGLSRIPSQHAIIDPKGCKIVRVTQQKKKKSRKIISFDFEVQHTFKRFDTILFVDAFNVAAFHYSPNHNDGNNPTGHWSNNPVSCDITTGEQVPFRLSPRPTCPHSEHRSKRVDNGVLKTYVPNKIVETHRAYKCYVVEQAVYASTNLIGGKDRKFLRANTKGVDEETCREWIKTKSCRIENRGPKECGGGEQTFSLFPVHGSMREYASYNKYTFKCDPPWKAFHVNEWRYFIYNCHIKIGEISATPPLFTLTSSFGMIPIDRQYNTSYKRSDGLTVIWDKFQPTDLCMWTLKSTANARKITYDSENILKQDRNPDVKEVIMYVADDIHQAAQTDNTLRIKGDKLHCVTPHYHDGEWEIYTNVDGSELFIFFEGERIRHGGVQHGIQAAHGQIAVDTRTRNITTVHHSTTFRATPSGPASVIEPVQQSTANKTTTATQWRDIQASLTVTNNLTLEDRVSIEDTLNYLTFKMKELDDTRIEQRGLQQCYNNQFAHDTFVTMMNIDPSTTLSNRLGVTVIADIIGNGFYAYRTCEDVKVIRVLEDLFTTSNLTYILNAKTHENHTRIRVSKYISSKGVVIDPRKCLSQPLVVFRNKLTRVENIGQLMLNNHINTKGVPFLEYCDGRHNEKIFHIHDKVYRFRQYELYKTIPFVTNAGVAQRIHDRDKAARRHGRQKKKVNDDLADIKILSVTPPRVRETPMPQIMTGLVGHTMYNMTERQSSLSTLTRIVEHTISDAEIEKQYTQQLLPEDPDFYSADSDFGEIMGEIGEGVGMAVAGVATGLIRGADGLVKEAGTLTKDVVDTAGGVLSDIGSALTGSLGAILLPIAIALAIGLAGFLVVRYFMTKKDGKPVIVSTTTTEPPQQTPPPYEREVEERGVKRRNVG